MKDFSQSPNKLVGVYTLNSEYNVLDPGSYRWRSLRVKWRDVTVCESLMQPALTEDGRGARTVRARVRGRRSTRT